MLGNRAARYLRVSGVCRPTIFPDFRTKSSCLNPLLVSVVAGLAAGKKRAVEKLHPVAIMGRLVVTNCSDAREPYIFAVSAGWMGRKLIAAPDLPRRRLIPKPRLTPLALLVVAAVAVGLAQWTVSRCRRATSFQ